MAGFNISNETLPIPMRHVNFVQDVQMVTCAWVLTLDPTQRCNYVIGTPQCSEDVFIVNYIELFYCAMDTSNAFFVLLGVIGLFFCCGLLFFTLGSTADGFFCPSLKVLSSMMGLNENVAGVTLLAFGNCAPDMITSITGLSGESRRLYSDTLGSSLFVVFCVAGSIIAFVPFDIQPSTFLRDSLFLVLSVLFIDYAMHTDNSVTVNEGTVILCIYLLYIVVVCMDQVLVKRQLKVMQEEALATVTSLHSSQEFARLSTQGQFEMHTRSTSHISVRPHVSHISHISYIGPNHDLFAQFIDSITPIDRHQWAKSNIFSKPFLVIKSTIVIVLKLLLPEVDFERNDQGWSKLLNCIQFVTLPFFMTWSIILCAHYCSELNSHLVDLDSCGDSLAVILAGCTFCTKANRHHIAGITGQMDHHTNLNRPNQEEHFHFPLEMWMLIVTIPIAICMFIFSRTDTTPFYYKYFSILTAFGSVYIIFGCAAETISILSVLGLTTQRSNSFLGSTLLAWGNSIGDLVANIALARQGYQKMGFAACFGGPLFNTLIGIGIGFTYKAATSPDMKTNRKTVAQGTMGVNNTIFIGVGVSMLIFISSITNFNLRRSIGLYMLALYGVFLTFHILGEMEVIHTYGSDHRLDVKLEESDILDFRPRSN